LRCAVFDQSVSSQRNAPAIEIAHDNSKSARAPGSALAFIEILPQMRRSREEVDSRPMIKFDAVRFSVQIALVSCLSYLAGIHFTALFHGASASIGGLWSAISGIVVLQGTRRDTWSSGSLRIVGTAVGSAISAAYLTVMSFSAIGMAASMFVTVAV
jgi:uncharacterized membrane protein YccC